MKNHFAQAALWFLVVILLAGLTAGCDSVRASLGKPISADLEALRQLRAAHEQAVRDSIAAAKAEVARLEAERAEIEAAAAALAVKRYYAVAGAFKEDIGVQLFEEKLKENGFKTRTFQFRSGLSVVCIDGSDSLEVVRRDMAALKKLHLAPTDPWIYDTKQKLHKEI